MPGAPDSRWEAGARGSGRWSPRRRRQWLLTRKHGPAEQELPAARREQSGKSKFTRACGEVRGEK